MKNTCQKSTSLSRFYKVRLKASSVKEIPTLAHSAEEAEEKIMNRYMDTGDLDFTDEDVVSVDVIASDFNEYEDVDGKEILTQLVRVIRDADASDEEMGDLLYDALLEVMDERVDAED